MMKATVYITEQGLKISRKGQRLRFESKEGKLIKELRLADIENLVIFGRANITTPAIHALLKRGINLHFLTLSGNYLGKLSPPTGKNVELRLKQHETFQNETRKTEIARSFVYGKIFNQKQYLDKQKRQKKKSELSPIVNDLKRFLKLLKEAGSVEEIMGIEGIASKRYFKGLSILLKGSGFSFSGRTKRPPKDPINALLSLGYTLLLTRMWSLTEIAGFDPYMGFLHSPDYGKPALALDLIEEWRPVLVDSLVIRIINWEVLKKTDFTEEPYPDEEDGEGTGVKLTKSGLKKFVKQFQNRLNEETTYPLFDKKYSYQDIMREQVYLLARVLKGEAQQYEPFKTA